MLNDFKSFSNGLIAYVFTLYLEFRFCYPGALANAICTLKHLKELNKYKQEKMSNAAIDFAQLSNVSSVRESVYK